MPMCQSELCPLRVLTQHFNQSIHNCDYSDMCMMPMCQSELCPLRVLTQHFNQSIHNCDYSDMCSLRGELFSTYKNML
ncbi:putative multiple inositol polyphosphate phosphatase 1 [Operophtera brumata]|uniref:Putative multiple inositol polyphosphate phosphatase 1 n=2 Tax=Operophtera brumata TaxID=104452 RepID=A0A0L7KPA5_OPEBR|nr:putative multiple inositol polyphosphate phosphatase 1 [Operophtera brumata]